MSQPIVVLVLAIVAGIFAGIGDSFLGQWAKVEARTEWLVCGFIVHNIAILILIFVIKKGTLAEGVAVFFVANFLIVTFTSQFIIGEPISSIRWAYLVIAILAVING